MNILSIDLARSRYRDFGFALQHAGSRTPHILKPTDLDLEGKPRIDLLAHSLNSFAEHEQVSVIVLDGPQGWKSNRTRVAHMRVCEKVVNTPGKTGLPGQVKPGNFLSFTMFSIMLMHLLRTEYEWNLLQTNWHRKPQRLLVESFPTASWKTLGLKPLPGKSRCKAAELKQWRADLVRATGYKLPQKLSHDELQACVMLPVGRAIAAGAKESVLLTGVKPKLSRIGDVLEGFIALPHVPVVY